MKFVCGSLNAVNTDSAGLADCEKCQIITYMLKET